MRNISEVVGKRIAKLRQEKELSQEALAELSGLNKNYIGNVERGEYNVTLRTLQKIAKSLDVTLVELLKKF